MVARVDVSDSTSRLHLSASSRCTNTPLISVHTVSLVTLVASTMNTSAIHNPSMLRCRVVAGVADEVLVFALTVPRVAELRVAQVALDHGVERAIIREH